MKTPFTRSLLFRVLAALLILTAPVLSGCQDDDNGKDAENRVAEYKVIDDELIQGYLTRRGYGPGTGLNQYERTESGLYLVKLKENSDTTRVRKGNQAEIKYVGRFLRATNETTTFDNSTEKGIPCGCLPLTVGAGQVIRGWDEGLLLMKKNDRKMLLVPSYLAYGPAGSGGIPPDEPLAFDMEVLDVR
ncbi:MAG: FKBP-type peptidyl-prolyl cis-trans isomerase [Hymenobacter sp.]|nr:FKBP-type peptidyl-prolyl cis-trans isomerase [Hymenobacter sp.]